MNNISWTFLDAALGVFYIGLFWCGWRVVLRSLERSRLRAKPAPRPQAAAQLAALAKALTMENAHCALPDFCEGEGNTRVRGGPLASYPDHDQVAVLADKTG